MPDSLRFLQQLDTDLWATDTSLKFFGLDVGARMTIVRLSDGSLLLHSPIKALPELVAEVKGLGPVSCLVAPNKFHHMFVGEWQQVCPDAATYVAPGLDKKRSDLPITGVLSDEAEAAWADRLDQLVLGGLPAVNEVVFFHRPSATLIVTDLAFNIGHKSPPLTRFAFRLLGALGRLGPTPVERLLMRDKQAFVATFERVLAWPFQRVVVTHGEVCEEGGREQLIEGYGWALGKKRLT